MRRLTAILGIVTAALCLVAAPTAHADVNDFTVTSFTADETLSRADPQGELRIVEHITVDFNDFNHGILRAIPNDYKHHRLQLHVNRISSDTGAPTHYTTYQQHGNTVLKIGDPARTVTGTQEYTLDYAVRNVITFYGDHDELYWDINGDQWMQPFGRVSATLHLPGGMRQSRSPICYAGSYGSRDQDSCAITAKGDTITATTVRPLDGYQTLSLVAGFRQGYFHPSRWHETLGEYKADIAGFLAGLLLPAVPAGLLWFRKGRDPKGRGVIVPQYDAPDGLGPIEVGTLIDFRTDNKDITAAIIDLAIRRYITIIEQKQEKKLRRDTTTYILRLEKLGFGELNEFERAIMTGLFVGAAPGEEVDLGERKFKMASTAAVLRSTVRQSLEHRGYFRPSPLTSRQLLRGTLVVLALIIAGLVAAATGGGGGFVIGATAGVALAILFIVMLGSRTEKGVEAREHTLGLKMYLSVAEADRIKKLQSPDAAYAPKSPEPKHTVALFEKLLPYAMILGVETQWAAKFENIYRTPPDWYSGNWTAFSAAYLASSLSSGIGQQVNSAFSAPSSSSGSGFGGGGAGGGGGGGGGGGW